MKNSNRRSFVKNLGIGSLAAIGATSATTAANPATASAAAANAIPASSGRKIWVATMTMHKMDGNTCEEIVQAAVKQMQKALPYKPDIICLPEAFHILAIRGKRPSVTETAENGSGNLTRPFQEFARKNNCYAIVPLYSKEGNRYHNTAFLIDRRGEIVGKYHKIRTTTGEMKNGISPGPLDPPVFKTDFGTIGIQTCFDIEWLDGWRRLREKGAELVFWPSAFAGGKLVNTMAWLNKFAVVSSTAKDTAKICDITGEELAASGLYDSWGVCAELNLEKAFLHSYPYYEQFPAIQAKYGQKVRIRTLHEEEFSIIESLSPDVKVADIMKEFNLKTHEEHLHIAEIQQRQHWM
ncbi:carbon-nitrogen hydrolase family protein [Dyadobacter sp. CY323]|uniref:carbon-nitrogen hydrolase family protein n=1 Tax=Dyadobacter sp. CY323 TaxID=2907302 RepID=UPI001F258886|nr:carbon-nitrogen hydrolase family protein [Dyadobacter sp. CY323]MCE6989778.1 carbon-nitrogen hydrolase family protein [Dyadobacter sp. CY323]